MKICKTLAINNQHYLKRATELDKYLSLFFVEICKSDGSDYVLDDLEGFSICLVSTDTKDKMTTKFP